MPCIPKCGCILLPSRECGLAVAVGIFPPDVPIKISAPLKRTTFTRWLYITHSHQPDELQVEKHVVHLTGTFGYRSRNMVDFPRGNWPLWSSTFRGSVYLRHSPKALKSPKRQNSTKMGDENEIGEKCRAKKIFCCSCLLVLLVVRGEFRMSVGITVLLPVPDGSSHVEGLH